MKRRLFPSKRRLLVLLAAALLIALGWFFWTPGRDLRDGRHDRGTNALWLQHSWLADDDWLSRNHKDPSLFRTTERLEGLARFLRDRHIRDLYPHLCPCLPTGEVAPYDDVQIERLLDTFTDQHRFRVFPWVGGAKDEQALVTDPRWRGAFAASCATLLGKHPRLAGVHVNIEPMPSGSQDFLFLLDELRTVLPPNTKISVAAYPPPTIWQRIPDVHWDETYFRAVAGRADQIVVMMYDTSLRSPRLYEQLMKGWSREVLTWSGSTECLLGIPAYEDAGTGYHDPAAENLVHALAGIHAGLVDAPLPANYAGVSLYSEWEMTPTKWDIFRERFLKGDAPGSSPPMPAGSQTGARVPVK